MSGAQAMLAAARRDLGLRGRPNRITLSYSSRNGVEFRTAPWCDQSITEWARASGNADAVLPKGDRAYTVWHAQDGADLGRWHAGTLDNIRRHAKPAAIVFFDWGGTNNIGQIDHVGLIERVLPDGRIQTIEANTGGGSGAVLRRVRSADVVAGFWNPDYEGDDMPSAKEIADAVYERLTGTVSEDVWAAREGLMKPGTKLDPRTFIRQVWSYGKDGYAQSRAIRAELGALNAAVKTLAEALAQRDQAIDPDALVARIRQEIAQVTVRLDVSDTPAS